MRFKVNLIQTLFLFFIDLILFLYKTEFDTITHHLVHFS